MDENGAEATEPIASVLQLEPHLTPVDLAERERVPLETVYSWNRTGAGPRYLRIGRHVRYPLVEVLAWETSRIVVRAEASA